MYDKLWRLFTTIALTLPILAIPLQSRDENLTQNDIPSFEDVNGVTFEAVMRQGLAAVRRYPVPNYRLNRIWAYAASAGRRPVDFCDEVEFQVYIPDDRAMRRVERQTQQPGAWYIGPEHAFDPYAAREEPWDWPNPHSSLDVALAALSAAGYHPPWSAVSIYLPLTSIIPGVEAAEIVYDFARFKGAPLRVVYGVKSKKVVAEPLLGSWNGSLSDNGEGASKTSEVQTYRM